MKCVSPICRNTVTGEDNYCSDYCQSYDNGEQDNDFNF